MELIVDPAGEARWDGRRIRCALGRGGVTRDKREGDGATPAGRFELVRVLYRADRLGAPATSLPVAALAQADGWCDAPSDPAYNRQVTLPYVARCESLWRDDNIYDVIVVTTHNADPVVAGRGSAIFVHVARPDYAPTEGCVAFARADLLSILADWRPGDAIRIDAA